MPEMTEDKQSPVFGRTNPHLDYVWIAHRVAEILDEPVRPWPAPARRAISPSLRKTLWLERLARLLRAFPPAYGLARRLHEWSGVWRLKAPRPVAQSRPSPARSGRLEARVTPVPRRFAVHQVTPSVSVGDGVTQGIFFTQHLLRELGYDSEIYAFASPPELRDTVKPYTALPSSKRQLLLVHHFIGSSHGPTLAARPECKILVYHNITPAEFFGPDDPLHELCRLGRVMLRDWIRTPVFAASIADSRLNADELETLGYSNVTVLPLLVNLDAFRSRPWNPAIVARHQDRFTLLFVGRIAPNKGQHHLIRLFRQVLDHIDRPAELLLVGGVSSDAYRRRILDEIDRLGIAAHVHLTGKVDDSSLQSFYRAADCFVCVSEHEGFGMPLIEAMSFDVPVIAWDSSSVGDTLGTGGLLFCERDLSAMAAAVVALARHPELRETILAGQRERLAEFAPDLLRRRLDAFVLKAAQRLCPAPTTSPNEKMKTSVVVCTYNRLSTLPTTLRALLALRHEALEVIVVNGPSHDGTADYLERVWGGRLKILDCPEANLSRARNLGIQAAGGDLIAFIDDDGIPEPDWICRAIPIFADPSVAAVGGYVRDHTGVDFQARCILSDRHGNSDETLESEAQLPDCVPGGFKFPRTIGVNSLFRRSALVEIGGFDEQYAYYHDETDVALRLVDAGYQIRCVPSVEVHHKFAPSHLRSERKVVRNWEPIARSTAYYCIRNAPAWQDLNTTLAVIDSHRRTRQSEIDWWAAVGLIDETERVALRLSFEEGVRQGIQDAFAHPWRRLGRFAEEAPSWQPLERPRPASGVYRLAFVTELYPPRPCGGVAVFIHRLAVRLAAEGHEVSVITLSEPGQRHTVDFEEGVWVHRLPASVAEEGLPLPDSAPPMPERLAGIAAAMARELERVELHRGFDWVIGAIWDLNIAAVLAERRYPVAMYLVTSYRRLLDSKPDWRADQRFYTRHYLPMVEAERWALQQADLVLASTEAIRRDTEQDYDVRIPPERLALLPFGLLPPSAIPAPRNDGDTRVRLLYVGRFESRKGIDLLLSLLPGLLDSHPDLEVRLIGDTAIPGPDGRPYLEGFLARHGAEAWMDRLEISGLVSDDDLEQAYADCDIFIAPSRYESFGLIYVEAMRYAKPCIGCRVGGVPEVVLDGETGLLVSPDDAEALRAAIARLIDAPETRQRLGRAGERRYRERYTIDAFAQAFVARLAESDRARREAVPAAE